MKALVTSKRQIKVYASRNTHFSGIRIRKEYDVPAQQVVQALLKMGFCESKRASPTVKHYRRFDGFHVVVTKRRKKSTQEVLWEDGASITTIKVHKDSIKHEKVLPFDKRAFFQEFEKQTPAEFVSPE